MNPARSWKRQLAVWGALWTLACASAPRSPLLDETIEVGQSQQVEAARKWAPQAVAHAEQLQKKAESARSDGDTALTEALAERALGAYQRAFAQARIARAEQRLATAGERLAHTTQELAALATLQQQVAARADALELEYKVVRDAEPLEPIAAADPGRETARRVAARSIAEAARLSCLAARLLDQRAVVSGLEGRLDALEARLDGSPRPTPIDEAMRLRSECLSVLTEVRRTGRESAPAEDPADELLSKLSLAQPDGRPFRDDRGVVVTLSDPFTARGELTPAAIERLTRLLEISQTHPRFPALLVLHASAEPQRAPYRLEQLSSWLQARGATHVTVRDAGARLPAAVRPLPGRPPPSRLEFVFVAP